MIIQLFPFRLMRGTVKAWEQAAVALGRRDVVARAQFITEFNRELLLTPGKVRRRMANREGELQSR
jgi:hypothetical protein